ncbi:MAG: hypothetical protein FWG40_09065 [Peptococcaceae bacterium]|nr:hypothetical protein [Peptococcaceae bacterium]
MGQIKLFLVLSLICVVYLSGCAPETETSQTETGYDNSIGYGSSLSYDDSFSVGVIETTEQENKSVLTLYNESLNRVGTLMFDLGSMGTFYDPPKIYKDSMYVIPKGLGNQKNLKCVLQVDLRTGTGRQYNLGLAGMNSFEVNDHYIFGVNTLNFQSVIARLDKTANVVKTITLPGTYIERLILGDRNLFAFGIDKSNDGTVTSDLYEIDATTLSILRKHAIGSYGISHHGALFVNGKLFFTNATKADGIRNESPTNVLTVYDPADAGFETIQLDAFFPAQILRFENKLLVTHCNLVTGEGKNISIYNLDTGETKLVSLDHNVSQISIHRDSLFMTDGVSLYHYKIAGTDLTYIQMKEVRTLKTQAKHYYIGALFSNMSSPDMTLR